MDRIHNGMRASDLGSEGWQKPWSGGNGGNCVEAMKLDDGRPQANIPQWVGHSRASSLSAAFLRCQARICSRRQMWK